jgi:adenosylhomocysteine nucleosidase
MTRSFIGVVCGLKSEAQAVAAAKVDQSKLRIGISGANAARAEEIARGFCNDGASAILSVGVSGGLDPALKPGDLVIGETIIADDGSVYASDRYLLSSLNSAHSGEGRNLPPRARKNTERDPGLRRDERGGYIVAKLFGADEIIDSTMKKSALFQNHGAVAVDMESHGAARAAARAGAPFVAIRAIADPADRALPQAALSAVAPDGSTRVMATLSAAMRDPKQFPELMKLGSDSAAATKALRGCLGPLFARLFLSFDL